MQTSHQSYARQLAARLFSKVSLLLLLLCLGYAAVAQTVYVTKTGEKYHRDGCRYLSKSKIEISLGDAKKKSYTACAVCKPSTSTT